MVKTGSIFRQFSRKLILTIKKQRHILIWIKGSPDPDVMAASFVLQSLCEYCNTRASIYSPLPPSLPQNHKMIKDLDISIKFGPGIGDPADYDSYAVLDHPSVEVDNITGILPCVIHVDHHEMIETRFPVTARLVITEMGSTSSIMAMILKELEPDLTIDPSLYQRMATALYFGIKTDTDGFKLANDADHMALDYVYPRVNTRIIKRIDELPLSKNTLHCLNLAVRNQVILNEWLVSGLGFIEGKNRDAIAISADFLMARQDISKVMVYALVKRNRGLSLDVSIRTREKRFNLNAFIKKITQEGGARTFKGGYQVNLDYFVNCPDPDLVWKVVSLTTLETLQRLTVTKKMPFLKQVGRWISKNVRSVTGKNRDG